MKIKISYSDDERTKADEMEKTIRRIFDMTARMKIRKPEKKQDYNHTYITIEKN